MDRVAAYFRARVPSLAHTVTVVTHRGEGDMSVEGDAVLLVIKDKDEPEGFSAVKFRAGPKLKDFIASVRRDEPEEGSVDLLAWED